MLKHATINQTNKVQQTLQLQRHQQPNQRHITSHQTFDGHQTHEFVPQAQFTNQSPTIQTLNCSPRPLMHDSRSTHHNNNSSMVRIFAQSLSQDVEYITMHVNPQTKSEQIVKSLLRKFRLKHRDPNLFYLTLERWIRKDGLKYKSVMLLGDEACPLQLQECCSNPPHNDIKFTLQTRTGALVKIFCNDVVADARYKCLSLSTQTTVDETIELMLHCLNLNANKHNLDTCDKLTPPRSAESPGSTVSASSSSSPSPSSASFSSSSGIESDPMAISAGASGLRDDLGSHSLMSHPEGLDENSRTSSVTSISSASNLSNSSTCASDTYCLVIECKNSAHQRVLESHEYLVEVYQNLLAEASREHESWTSNHSVTNGNINDTATSASYQNSRPDQWFHIKLKRREACVVRDASNMIKFTNPRQNDPLPPIPLSLAHINDTDSLQSIVSTTQIEVNARPSVNANHQAAMFYCNNNNNNTDMHRPSHYSPNDPNSSDPKRMPPPPAILSLWIPPPVMPRRRNLSNASTTFSPIRTNANLPAQGNNSRRRYDPAQLAEDLSKLDVAGDSSIHLESRPQET